MFGANLVDISLFPLRGGVDAVAFVHTPRIPEAAVIVLSRQSSDVIYVVAGPLTQYNIRFAGMVGNRSRGEGARKEARWRRVSLRHP